MSGRGGVWGKEDESGVDGSEGGVCVCVWDLGYFVKKRDIL